VDGRAARPDGWWFLAGELRGIGTLGLIWLGSAGRDTPTRRRRVYRLRQRWCAGHLSGVRRLFGLRFELEGLELAAPGPVVILVRHASIIDNTLPDAIIGAAHDLGLRFVIKRELQMLPTIDVGGRWVPTVFVRRGSGDTDRELAQLRRLGDGPGRRRGPGHLPRGHAAHRRQARAREGDHRRAPAPPDAPGRRPAATSSRRGWAAPSRSWSPPGAPTS
jgi:1-acyl-sn-glycerol-3-phosphate acyltransferase